MTIEIIRVDTTLGKLVYELFDKYRVFYDQVSDLGLARKFIQERLYNNESVIFTALLKGVPVGFVQLYPTFSSVRLVRNWILNDLFVEEGYRQQGVGETLIREAIEFAKAHDAKSIQLSTAVDNFTAQRLYEQIGFERVEAETTFYHYQMEV
jgi:ribosomal protein S18 acetylase RimI-like enzyme